MKKYLLLGFALFFSAIASYGQMSKQDIEKMAAEQSTEMNKEGWKAKIGSMPLKYQLIKSFTMQNEFAGDNNKYMVADGQVTGATFEAARIHAMEVAKRNLISIIDNMSLSETEGNSINVEGGEGVDGENLSDTKYTNKSSLELGNLITVISCYREKEDGKIEVMVQLACTRESAVKAKLKQTKVGAKAQNSTQEVVSSHTL